MQSFTVVLDACVLVPVTAADTLLRLAEREMYRPVWSERILEEAKRAVARLHPELSAEQVESSLRLYEQSVRRRVGLGLG
jgi:hypothetical protein